MISIHFPTKSQLFSHVSVYRHAFANIFIGTKSPPSCSPSSHVHSLIHTCECHWHVNFFFFSQQTKYKLLPIFISRLHKVISCSISLQRRTECWLCNCFYFAIIIFTNNQPRDPLGREMATTPMEKIIPNFIDQTECIAGSLCSPYHFVLSCWACVWVWVCAFLHTFNVKWAGMSNFSQNINNFK